jgi:hypothetical protein
MQRALVSLLLVSARLVEYPREIRVIEQHGFAVVGQRGSGGAVVMFGTIRVYQVAVRVELKPIRTRIA